MPENHTNQADFYTTHCSDTPEHGGLPQIQGVEQYMTRVFAWMLAGLGFTFLLMVVIHQAVPVQALRHLSLFYWGLLIGEMVVVTALSGRISRLTPGQATGLFFLYAGLNGLTFGLILYAYDLGSLVFAFFAAAVYFGVMAAYGHFTKKDISSWGRMLFSGLIAMLIVSVVGIFIGFGPFELLLSGLGILLFLCLTAFDTQQIKSFYNRCGGSPEMGHKMAILGALELYMDFINLFIRIVHLLGRARDD